MEGLPADDPPLAKGASGGDPESGELAAEFVFVLVVNSGGLRCVGISAVVVGTRLKEMLVLDRRRSDRRVGVALISFRRRRKRLFVVCLFASKTNCVHQCAIKKVRC